MCIIKFSISSNPFENLTTINSRINMIIDNYKPKTEIEYEELKVLLAF